MNKILTFIILIASLSNSYGQISFNEDSLIFAFNNEYSQISNTISSSKKISIDKKETTNVNTIGNSLMELLIAIERPTEFEKDVSPITRKIIANKEDPYILVLLERAISENIKIDISLHLKSKLLKEIGTQINLLSKKLFPYYNYKTTEKQLIKFVSVRSGNDLFTLTGLYDLMFLPTNKYIRDGNTFFQRNDDRDYTGSLLIEIGTDYLRTLRKRPLKTYQTVLFGFDVFTPYFKDSLKFPSDTSYNTLDRPHASFQYFGWSKKGLSKGSKYKWETTLKFGKIGGSAGAKFQNALHQDISYSPRPRGWGAQIANGGRIGFSIEFKEEFFPKSFPRTINKANENDLKNIYLSLFAEQKLGTYMTTAGLGVQLSNKSFGQNNQNFINHRTRQTLNKTFQHLMYKISLMGTYVKHNTMLEGYGLFNTKEDNNDYLTPRSRYFLKKDQVRRMNYLLNTTVSYTTRFATFFYNWKSISPETKFSNIGIKSPASGIEMNIAKRWQHFAEIGFTFNVH